jgi:hypothetical protein
MIPTLSGSYIDETYGRLVQVSGSEYADGFGNPISFLGGAGGPINSIQINSDGSNFTGYSALTFQNNSLTLTGSFLVTGSTTQIGNNSLLGNTSLSGSITISGSTNTPTTPTIRVYGDMQTDGVIKFMPVNKSIDTSISASYIYVSGSTNDLYFSQNGKGFNNVTRLRWLEGNLYTGLLHGGIISQLTSTTYQVSSGSGIIVNLNASIPDEPYPIVQYLNWGNLSASIAPLTASYDQTFVAINSNTQITGSGIPYNDGDYNTKIPIGIVLHQNRSTINGVQTFPGVAYGWKQRSFDFIKAFGPLKISGYTLTPSGSSTRGLALSGGVAWVDGRNYTIDPTNPSYITEATGITTSKIYRYYQSGSEWKYDTNNGVGYTDIDPTKYSSNGTLTPVSNNHWSIQRVYYFPNSATKALFVYYGNSDYANKTDALSGIITETFNEAPNTFANAIFVGYMLLRNNATFANAASYEFRAAGLFRASAVGAAGGSTLASLASLTDVTLGTLSDKQSLVYDLATDNWINSYQLSGSLTGSLLGTASYATNALTASFAPNYVLNSVTASFATTGSNTFRGNQTISGSVTVTGSLTVSGSSTFTNIGPAIFSGSVTSTNGFTGSFSGSYIGDGSSISGLPSQVGGNTYEIQYNAGGGFGGISGLTYDGVSLVTATNIKATGIFAEKMTTTILGNTDPATPDLPGNLDITETGTYILSTVFTADPGQIYFPDPSLYVGQKIRIQNRDADAANINNNGNRPIDITDNDITEILGRTTKTFIAGERAAGAYSWLEI